MNTVKQEAPVLFIAALFALIGLLFIAKNGHAQTPQPLTIGSVQTKYHGISAGIQIEVISANCPPATAYIEITPNAGRDSARTSIHGPCIIRNHHAELLTLIDDLAEELSPGPKSAARQIDGRHDWQTLHAAANAGIEYLYELDRQKANQ